MRQECDWPYIALAGVGTERHRSRSERLDFLTSEDPGATQSPCAERSGSGLALTLTPTIVCNVFRLII